MACLFIQLWYINGHPILVRDFRHNTAIRKSEKRREGARGERKLIKAFMLKCERLLLYPLHIQRYERTN